MSQEIARKYSPDSSTVMMRRSHTDLQPSDTIRFKRRNEETDGRPAPPPYIGQAIPRVKPIRTFQKTSNNCVGENSRPTSRRFDTFGENALETIYDQFKFLDESEEAPPSAAQTPTSVNSTRPIMAMNHKKRPSGSGRPVLFCVLPILELLAAIAILVTSFVTNRKDLENRRSSTEVSDSSSLASEAMHTLSVQSALSTVIPCSFQIVSALFGFWPLFPRSKRRSAQILHIFLSSVVILLWFNAIFDLFFKISMSHILQKPAEHSDEKYVVDLVFGCFLYFATVILPSITVCVATFHVAASFESRWVRRSMIAISVSLGTLLFSLATTIIAIFTAQASVNGEKNMSDTTQLLAYGLKESIVFVFVLLISIFSLIIATQNRRSLMFSAIIGQGICVLSITNELFTSDRISAIFDELKTFETSGSVGEIGLVLLNGCAVVSLALLVLQIVVFVFCVSSPSHGSQHSLVVDNNRNPPGRHVERTAF